MSHRQPSTVCLPATASVTATSCTVAVAPTGTHRAARKRLLWTISATLALATAVAGGEMATTHGHTQRTTVASAVSATRTVTLSAGATLAVSRGLGGELAEYRLAQSSGGFVARNTRQELTADFGAHGATIATHNGARVNIALQAIGFGDALHPAAAARPLAQGNRVEYRRGGVTEWFANGPAGVEQGFTVDSEPRGTESGKLTLSLGVSGTLAAQPGTGGGLVLVGADGKAMLRYGDLSVTDARGRALPARMTAEHGRVLIGVDARGARYPLTVDPLLNSLAELYASDGAKEDQLGSAIAASEGTVVVGEPLDTVGGHVKAGSAYVFTEGAGGWATATQATKLVASNAESEEAFGASVAISGETIVVGAPGRKSGSGVDAGGAYVYSKPIVGGWSAKAEQTETAELYNSEDVALYSFGTSVAISGETIVVGTPFYRDYGQSLSPPADGAAFVFLEPAGGWANEAHHPEYQTATLVPHESEVENDGHFGQSVAIGMNGSEQTVVVGAPVEPVGTEPDKYQRGIVFLFSRPAGGWNTPGARFPEAHLTASDATEFANLGESVAIDGDTIAAGAPRAEVASVRQGATYVFTAPADGWVSEPEQTQAAKLTTPGGIEGDQYGESVALEGGTVVAGGELKSAFLFAMPSSGWSGEIHQSAEFAGNVYAVGLSGGDALMGLGEARPPGGTGEAEQGAVDVVPFAPVVTTGASGASEGTATVEGSVNPDQTTLSSCKFQYGISASYDQEAPCSSFPTTGAGSSPVSASLTGLTPGTTYHYRILATNEVDTSYGEDRTFTTAATTGEGPESTTPITTTPTTTTPTTTTPTTTTPTTPPTVGPTVTPQPSPALACTTAQVALINVVQQGSHVEITGAARLVLAGKRVNIRFLATHKTVASATISANGTFSASATLPPSKIRESNLARYEAIVGSLHSLNLKLDRRMYMTSVTRSGADVVLSGYVSGSFKAGTVVKILLRVTCSKEKVIAKVKLTGSGKFNATVPAPTGAASQIAVYRGTTTVLKDGHPEGTFTLPTPPSS